MSLPLAINIDQAAEVLASLDALQSSGVPNVGSHLVAVNVLFSAQPQFSVDPGKAPRDFVELAGKCTALDGDLDELIKETKVFLEAAVNSYRENDASIAAQV